MCCSRVILTFDRQVTNLAVELASAAIQPATADSLKERSEMQKRLQFMKTMDWSRLRGLLINSGVLRVNPTTNALEVHSITMLGTPLCYLHSASITDTNYAFAGVQWGIGWPS